MGMVRLPVGLPTLEHSLLLTRNGLRQLEAELADIEREGRAEVVDRLRAAREFGDGAENSELLGAKAEIERVEARIRELNAVLSCAELITPGRTILGEARVGSRVLMISEFGKEEFLIVGSVEADPLARRISNESPLGKALIGRRCGDDIAWASPDGLLHARIERVA